MAKIPISKLPQASSVAANNELPIVQSGVTKKALIEDVGKEVNTTQQYSDLNTTDKTPIGAINEVNSQFSNISGKDVSFDNEDTDLEATNTEDAIKEVDSKVNEKADASSLAEVATSGSYNDLTDKPTIPKQVQSDWNEADNTKPDYIKNKPNLSTVATSGNYNDLSNKPTIPPAQVNSDWNADSGVSQILNKPNLSTVATTGNYDDLNNKPSVAVIDDTQASASKVYSSEKVDDLLADKADKSELTNVYGIAPSGENLADSSKFVTGAVQSNGTVATHGSYANYVTSDFIPLEPNKKYTLSTWYSNGIPVTTRMMYLLYNDKDTPVSATYYNETSSDHATFNSGNYKYVRVSSANSVNLMFSEGDMPSSFVDYSEQYEIKCFLGNNAKRQVEQIVEGGNTFKLVKSGDDITVTSKVGANTLQRTYKLTRTGSTNNVFNFVNASLDRKIVKYCSDDITPVRILVNGNSGATIGANHGWNFAYKCDKGNFGVVDIGSLWTDGTTQYMLLSVYNGYAYFVPPVTKSGGMIYCTDIAPVSDLTHISGATHTASVPKASLTKDQLYPSINNRVVSLILDGEEITEDGTYYANKAQVVETYGIMDLYELYVYAGANVGSVDFDEVTTLFSMSLVYEITDNAEVVYTNLKANEGCTLGDCGFLQAQELTANGGTVFRYVNGVASGTFASNSLVDMTNYNTNYDITSSEVKTGQMPNRCVDVCKDNNNKILYGFALGYIPDIGDGSDTARGSNTRLWDMRNTKKIYPICIVNNTRTLAQGENVDVVGYRAYFGTMANATGKFTVKIGDKIYSVFDTHSTASGSIEGGKLGNKVEVVNNDGATVGDFVNANGISYYSSNSYSAFVVKS